MNVLCTVFHFGIQRTGLGTSLRCREGRGRCVRRLGRAGLHFFAGVSRRFHALLALVVMRMRLLLRLGGLGPSICGQMLGVCGGTERVHSLISRLLSFQGRRRKFLGLGIRCVSVMSFAGRVCVSFCRCTLGRSIGCGFRRVRRGLGL